MSSSSSCLWLLSTESSLQSWTFPTPSTPLPPFPQALTLLALDMGGPLSMSITQVKCAVILLDMDQSGCFNWNCREGICLQSSNKIFIIVLGSIIGFLRTREDLCWKYHSRLTFSGEKLIFKNPISCHLFLKDGLKYLLGMHPLLHQAARPRGSLKLNF